MWKHIFFSLSLLLFLGRAFGDGNTTFLATNTTTTTIEQRRAASLKLDNLIEELFLLNPQLAASVIDEHDNEYPDPLVASASVNSSTPQDDYTNVRYRRKATGAGGKSGIAVLIPKNADKVALLGIAALKGVPKQVTLTVVQINNLLASLGIARTLFLLEPNVLLELAGCFAYCGTNAQCIKAAQECEPASLNYQKCLEDAEKLITSGSYSSNNHGRTSTAYSGNQNYLSLTSYHGIQPYTSPAYNQLYLQSPSAYSAGSLTPNAYGTSAAYTPATSSAYAPSTLGSSYNHATPAGYAGQLDYFHSQNPSTTNDNGQASTIADPAPTGRAAGTDSDPESILDPVSIDPHPHPSVIVGQLDYFHPPQPQPLYTPATAGRNVRDPSNPHASVISAQLDYFHPLPQQQGQYPDPAGRASSDPSTPQALNIVGQLDYFHPQAQQSQPPPQYPGPGRGRPANIPHRIRPRP